MGNVSKHQQCLLVCVFVYVVGYVFVTSALLLCCLFGTSICFFVTLSSFVVGLHSFVVALNSFVVALNSFVVALLLL